MDLATASIRHDFPTILTLCTFFPWFFQAASSKKKNLGQKLHCQDSKFSPTEFCWFESKFRSQTLIFDTLFQNCFSIKSKDHYRQAIWRDFSPDVVDLRGGDIWQFRKQIWLFFRITKSITLSDLPISVFFFNFLSLPRSWQDSESASTCSQFVAFHPGTH